MSAHASSFPWSEPDNRDLSDFELWERSLRRSVHRREITEAARKHAARRKGAAVAVSASMAVGPTAAPFAALASSGGPREVAAQKAPVRSAIQMPSGSLVEYGDTGEAVAAIQRVVGVDDDGIFGPITRGAVERFQAKMGLAVTGQVDAKTWAKLFQSNVSFVSGGGKTTYTVYGRGRSSVPSTPDGSEPASTVQTTKQATNRSVSAPAATPEPADPVENRAQTTKPQATTPAPAPAPVQAVGGCGTGKIATPVSGTTTGTFGEGRSNHTHAGKDIAAPTGTAVRAAQCGTVTKAGAESGGYGNLVCISHANGVSTCYAHLSEINTTKGAYVHVGDVIGKVGCTGSCTGPHLHFEVRESDKPVDPEPYLAGSKTIPAGTGSTKASAALASNKSATTAQAATAALLQIDPATGQPVAADPAAAQAATAPAATDPAAAQAATAPAATDPAAAPVVTASAPQDGTAPAPAEAAPAAEAPVAEAPAPAPAAEAPAAEAPAPTAEAPAPEAPAPAAPAPVAEAPAPAPAAEAPAPAPAAEAPAPAPAPAETAPAPEAPAPAAPAPVAEAPAPAPAAEAPAPAPAPAETAPAPEAPAPAAPAPAAEAPAPEPVAEAPAPEAPAEAPAPAVEAPVAEAPAAAPAAEAPASPAEVPAG